MSRLHQDSETVTPLAQRSERRVIVETLTDSPLRAARAKALLAWITTVAVSGVVHLDGETIARLTSRGWTRGTIDRALEDLARSNAVTLDVEPARVLVRLAEVTR